LKWLREVVLKKGNISKEDLDIFTLVDTPKEVILAINKFYAKT